MKNEYEIRGDVTAIIINSPKYGRKEALISTNKLERAKELRYTWRVSWSRNIQTFYVQGNIIVNGKQITFKLHRWITNAPEDMQVDHKNHNGLDNTDENLRVVTQAENQQNRLGASKINKSSGIRGVSWFEPLKKWRAQIWINKKHYNIGYFDDVKEAEMAIKEARAKLMPYSKEASA